LAGHIGGEGSLLKGPYIEFAQRYSYFGLV